MKMGEPQAIKPLEEVDTAKKWRAAALIAGILLIGANLRAPLTSVGPLVPAIRDSLGITNAVAGTITTLPLLAFALLSPFAPKISRRFGIEWTLFAALIALAAGIGLRSSGGVGALFAGTVLLGLAIAIGNVLLPGFIKQHFAKRLGVMTGVYSVSMNLCGAVASGLSVPLASGAGFGWSGALGVWGGLALIAILFWLPQLRRKKQTAVLGENRPSSRLWHSRLAWQVTLFMGLQSLIFYVVITWLPDILQQKGMDAGSAGWMLSMMQFSVLPFTFIVPVLAGRQESQRGMAAATAALFTIGLVGVLFDSGMLLPLWIILVGIGAGSAFSLAMMFFSLRTQSTQEAAELSGMAQSFGYLLASIGPVLFGGLHDMTGSWTLPLATLVAASVLIFIIGLSVGKKGYVTSPAEK
ncbi:transporter [Bacillus wudalianchiensis]|uniref:Transporter n=2 Tax=Pseudobacillus wudalianchiensis TaxID=1743143 RepID=A0A1B9ABS3_9BACI|nr:MFS transporter [Bacillus wudalianchiensis]OCA81302.1 transporter [Bacillus wudalianchiensis]